MSGDRSGRRFATNRGVDLSLHDDPLLDARTKGLPCGPPLRLSEVGAKRWNVLNEDLPLPVAVLRQSALRNNGRWMREFAERTGALLAPHGKTTMSPQLFAMQMADGAWGLTLATVQQLRVARAAGVSRVIVANQLVGAQDIGYVLDQLASDRVFECYCLVDSLAGVRRLSSIAASRAIGRPLTVLVELGYTGGRGGCRDVEEALDVARAVKHAEPHLALAGIEGFEGLIPQAAQVREFLQCMLTVALRADTEGLFGVEDVILSAGGSAYYDVVCESLVPARLNRRSMVLLRSGCYFSHDARHYERLFNEARARGGPAAEVNGRLENALEIWAHVVSVPEPGRAIIGAGRRDFGHDSGMPVLLKQFRPGRDVVPRAVAEEIEIVAVNDQHAHMSAKAAIDMQVGDLVALGISHPCTTFDKWRLLYLIDDSYTATAAVQTFF